MHPVTLRGLGYSYEDVGRADREIPAYAGMTE